MIRRNLVQAARPLSRIGLVVLPLLIAVSAARADPLDDQIEGAMKAGHVPGLTLAVVKNRQIVRLGAYGLGNVEWDAKATNDTRFEIASISKMFVGAAVRILIEEGKLSPEDRVSKYLPGAPAAWAGMKVRHLITMSSGLPEDFGGPGIPYDADVMGPGDDASMMTAFAALPPECPVGAEFHYSGPNYAMLGMIVAKISGTTLPQFVTERVFKPAGMTDSSYIDGSAVVAQRAEGYRTKDGKLLRGHFLGQYLHVRPDVGVLTTARDLARFVIALEERRVVNDPEPLWAGATSDTGRPLDYSYGWTSDTLLGRRLLDHSGGYRTGFHTMLYRFPDDGISIIVLTNCDFSSTRRFALLAAMAYLEGMPLNPLTDSAKPDPDAERTAALIRGMKGIVAGTLDEKLFASDALEPIGLAEVSGFLKPVTDWAFAGSARLPSPGMRIHGHTAVDFVTLRLLAEGEYHLLTLYRDAEGKVVHVEAT